ncbi:putative oRF22 (plasmid) [Klebsiella pneumoniae]|nr:putative oRF22 [Klebsiella pneumoniae]
MKVRLYQPAGAVTETWRIIREKDARQNDIIRLQRPNGALVMQNLQGKESP